MKKWLTYSALFIVAYLGFLIVNVPAAWVVEQVELPKGVEIKSPQGTLWDARFEAVRLPQDVILHNVEVRLSLLSVLLVNPSADITFGAFNKLGPQGSLKLSHLLSDIKFTDVNIDVSANDVVSQMDLPIALTAHNDINIDISEYQMGKPLCTVTQGNVNWAKASITSFDQTIDLGPLKAVLSCEEGVLYITVDPQNNLGLSYEVVMRSENQVSGNGFIKPGTGFPEELKLALPFLGNPDSSGRYALKF